MKKTLIAVAALAATGAFAQVSVYGRLDVGYANTTSTVGTVETKANGVQSHNNVSSFWGIKGEEDLGGGMKAMFKLEQDVYVANGNTGTSGSGGGTGNASGFNRTSLLGLSGAFGTVAAGRDYTPVYKLGASSDAFNQARITTVQMAAGAGQSTAANLLFYSTPNFNGFQVNVAYGNQDTSVSSAAGDTSTKITNLTATYANGPLMAGFGTGSTEVTSAGAAAGTFAIAGVTLLAGNAEKTTGTTLVATYNFGTFKLFGNTLRTKGTAGATDAEGSELNLGVTAPLGKVLLKAGVGTNKIKVTGAAEDWTGSDLVLGADYALSSKTALYALTGTYAKLSGNGDTYKQTSTAFGVKTVF